MNAAAELHRAYVLHSRSYRETSLIVDFLVPDVGRLSAVVKGARRAKSPQRSLLQPFYPLLVSWQGKGELKSLRVLESNGNLQRLQGKALFSALYLNELLVRLLKAGESCETLFEHYQQAIATLATMGPDEPIEAVLRCFEMRLLETLGYSLSFPQPADAAFYYLSGDNEWLPLPGMPDSQQQPRSFKALELSAIAGDDYQIPEVRRAAKRLMRLLLTPLLGNRPLKSKELFRQATLVPVQPIPEKNN
ncbi:MAG: DNA repair protein RecO [Pseudomonadales bacterium]